MLRPAAGRWGDRLGGWTAVAHRPPREASVRQQGSLLILLAAAVVAMAATVLDVRLPANRLSAVGAAPASVAAGDDAAPNAEVSAGSDNSDVGDAGDVASAMSVADAQRSDEVLGEAVSGELRVEGTAQSRPALSEPVAATRALAATESSASAVDSEVAAVATNSVTDHQAELREYLGLPSGAMLPVSFSYEVQAGDTASSIAARFGLQEATVLFNNFDIYDPNHLDTGQVLLLPPVDGLVYTIQPGDSLSELMINYLADLDHTLAYPANGIAGEDAIQAGQAVLLVQGSASLPSGAAFTASAGSGISAAQTWSEPTFLWPLGYDEISDPFGVWRANAAGYHTGVDFVASVGTIVGSTAAGQVTVAAWGAAYGNWVEIDHGGGFRSRYAHLDEIWVREGEWVNANAFIGTVGNTGYSSGPHLHFEIIVSGRAENPLAWLN